jgi:hypothetical protein
VRDKQPATQFPIRAETLLLELHRLVDGEIRQHQATRDARFGLDRARRHGRAKIQIQGCLSAAIQNIEVQLRYGYDPTRIGAGLQRIMGGLNQVRANASANVRDFLSWLPRLVISVDQVKLSDPARLLPMVCFGRQAVKR